MEDRMGKGIREFRIKCLEGQKKCADDHENRWKSELTRVGMYEASSGCHRDQEHGRCPRDNRGDPSCDSLDWRYGK